MNRNRIKARCIIYHATNGNSYARSFYGSSESVQSLKDFLKKNDIKICSENFQVMGYGKNLSKSTMYDGLRKIEITLKTKKGKYIKLLK